MLYDILNIMLSKLQYNSNSMHIYKIIISILENSNS